MAQDDYFYIKFEGPQADDGQLDLGKAGKTLIAVNKWAKLYKKEYLSEKVNFTIKIGGVKKNCTELQIFIEIVDNVANAPLTQIGLVAAGAANLPGVKDFLKGFGGTVGTQLALKLFSNGQNLRESEPFAKDGKVYVKAINEAGTGMDIEKAQLDFYRKSNHALNGFYVLEPGKEDKVRFGTVVNQRSADVASITTEHKDSFVEYEDPDSLTKRMNESFDEDKAKPVKIIGQFVDSYGMAHRYKFSFQARRDQEEHGKQKILCVVDDKDISPIIDLLKPENKKNICIGGKATKDFEGKTDKIKIEWFSEDPNYNPDQTSIV